MSLRIKCWINQAIQDIWLKPSLKTLTQFFITLYDNNVFYNCTFSEITCWKKQQTHSVKLTFGEFGEIFSSNRQSSKMKSMLWKQNSTASYPGANVMCMLGFLTHKSSQKPIYSQPSSHSSPVSCLHSGILLSIESHLYVCAHRPVSVAAAHLPLFTFPRLAKHRVATLK